NGRSITALITERPGKRSRTSTQAVIVPKTALTSAARMAATTLSFSAATASGFEIEFQNPDRPSSRDAATTAASGSTTISVRYPVTNPRERAVPALSLGRARPRRAVAADGAALARGRAPDPTLDLDHDPVGREPLLVHGPPAAEDLVVDLEDAWPRRVLRRVLLRHRRQHRAPARLAEEVLCDRALREPDEFLRELLAAAVLDHGDRQLDQHRLPRDHVLDVRACRPRGQRLALVGQQHVTLARQERVGRVPAGGVLRDDVLEQRLHVRLRRAVGLAESPLGAVGGED